MFDSQLRVAGGDRAILADLLKGMIENPAGLPDYQVLQSNFGLTAAGLAATGLAPTPGAVDDNGFPVPLDEIDLEGSAVIVPEDE